MRMAAGAFFFPLLAAPSHRGSKDEAVAMVPRVEDIISKEGVAAPFRAASRIDDKSSSIEKRGRNYLVGMGTHRS